MSKRDPSHTLRIDPSRSSVFGVLSRLERPHGLEGGSQLALRSTVSAASAG